MKGRVTMKYQITFTEEMWYRVEIEAENEEQVYEKFWSADFDSKPELFGSEIQQDISINVVEEVSA